MKRAFVIFYFIISLSLLGCSNESLLGQWQYKTNQTIDNIKINVIHDLEFLPDNYFSSTMYFMGKNDIIIKRFGYTGTYKIKNNEFKFKITSNHNNVIPFFKSKLVIKKLTKNELNIIIGKTNPKVIKYSKIRIESPDIE